MTNRGAAGAAALLLLAEYLALSIGFDVQPLRARSGLATGLGWLGALAPLIVVLIAAFALVRPSQRSGEWSAPRGCLGFLTIHALTYAALWALTPRVAAAPTWTLAWFASVIVSCFGLLFAMVSPRAIRNYVAENRIGIARASLIGLAAFSLASWSGALWPLLVEISLIGAATTLMAWGEAPLLLPERNLLGVGDFVVEVSNVCSGMEGVGLILVFLTTYILFDRRRLRLPHAWLALPVAVAAVLAANVIRIAALVWVGGHGWPEVAMGGFHSKAGWVLFSAVALSATALTGRVFGEKTTSARPAKAPNTQHDSDAAPFLVPLLSMIAAGMVSGLFVVDTPAGHPLVVLAGLVALLWARPRWPFGQLGRPSWALALGYGALVYVLWMAAISEPDFDGAFRRAEIVRGDGWWIAIKLVGTIVIVPLVEELAFRGFLQRRLSASNFASLAPRASTWWGLAGASLVFGLLHQDMLAGFAAGLVYGWLYRRTERLSDAIAAHGVTNALLAVHAVAGDAWWLWL